MGIVGLGPMSIVDLSNWHVDIASGIFTFLVLLLILTCKYCQPRFHAKGTDYANID